MGELSRYWNIWRINPASERVGYKLYSVPLARDFLQKLLLRSNTTDDIQSKLLSLFHSHDSSVDNLTRAMAGLCLRCYISDPILKACQKIDDFFGGEKHFTYQDLLPFVLNDDGETLVILDKDGKTQLILDDNGKAKTTAYKFFSVKVLQTFKADRSSISLDNWAYLQTKQNPEIKDFLLEIGFKHLSDWALLNRARPRQIERLSQRDRHLVEVFHAVYRRDRLQQGSKALKRCPDPSSAQLLEMLNSLQQRNVIINTTLELTEELRLIAAQLRQYDVWNYREPLEVQNPETGGYTLRRDVPTDSFNELDVEQRELLEFLHEQLKLALATAIEKEMGDRITTLQKSKKYAFLAQQFIPGLKLYYCEGMSLKDIAPKLGMTSWDQARRVLNPGELLSKVRTLTVQLLLENILKKAQEKGLTKIPPEPEYFKNLAEQIEAFVDEEIFQEAADEIRSGNCSKNSFYAQQLRSYLINSQERIMSEVKPLLEKSANANQSDLSTSLSDKLDGKQRELLEFLHEQLKIALAKTIEQEVKNHITTLQTSKKYSSLAKQFVPGLQLYYCEGMPLREIAPKLGMTSWNQARRVLNPGELLAKVRAECVQQLLNRVLKKASEKGLTKIPPEPDYLETLKEQIEAFADEEVFQKAVEEIRAGKNRSMNSVYAQQLRSYLQEQKVTVSLCQPSQQSARQA